MIDPRILSLSWFMPYLHEPHLLHRVRHVEPCAGGIDRGVAQFGTEIHQLTLKGLDLGIKRPETSGLRSGFVADLLS